MTRRNRPKPTSLLLPDHLDKPPKPVAEANTAHAAAIEAVKGAGAVVREARVELRTARGEDAAPAVIRKQELAVETAEHGYREAKRTEDKARTALADVIHRERRPLFEQIDVEHQAELVENLLAKVGTELGELAEQVGTVRTLATINEERTRLRGFEPIRTPADRFNSPEAHLAALHGHVEELRGIARRLTERSAPAGAPSEEIAA